VCLRVIVGCRGRRLNADIKEENGEKYFCERVCVIVRVGKIKKNKKKYERKTLCAVVVRRKTGARSYNTHIIYMCSYTEYAI